MPLVNMRSRMEETMGLIQMTKHWTLVLATVRFNFSLLIWFSFAPFTGPIAAAIGPAVTAIGVLVSAPFGHVLTGWLSDKFGTPTV